MQLWRYGQAIERLGERYRLEGSLGSGGMADVCLAWDEQLQAEVAIKVIKAEGMEQRTLNRFLKEAAQVAKWRHPHILRFYGEARLELLDPARGSVVPYIVMEYARGGDLHHRLRKGQPYPLLDTLVLFSQLCSAVAYAHAHGLIHRDLKPQNILFRRLPDGSEQALLSDFGLAVEVSATHHTFAHGGTLPYMAPEQLRGQPIPSSDLFSLGVILYQLCTGRLPFQRTLRDLHRSLPHPPLPTTLNPELPAVLDAIILRALADEPAQRYATADELWLALKNVANPTSRTTTPYTTGPVPTPRPTRPVPTISSPTSQSTRILVPLQSEPASTISPPPSIPDTDPGARSTHIYSSPGPISDASASQIPSSPGPISRANAPRTPSTTDPVSRTRASRVPSRSASDAQSPRIPANPAPSTNARHHPVPRRGRAIRRPARLLIPALLLLALILAIVVNVQLNILPNPFAVVTSSDPTITITPVSQPITQNYTIVLTHDSTTSPDQFTSHTISATANDSQTIATTGKAQTQGTQAKGELQFLNGAFVSQTILTGSVVIGADGIQVITDENAVIPAANPDTRNGGRIMVAAHAANVGSKGNILALDINKTCCVSDGTIFVKNLSAFTGGQDAQSYHFPTQDDVDQVSQSVQANLEQKARQQLQSQLASGEQLAA
ncbi:MAG TPA: protein kinase, partial [Ktedonobacteraceae bacterium]|nr:protein kinase [Ktedonobacteraceae bacterium]